MTHPEHIRPVTVTRDRNGFWTPPHYFQPASDEATRAEFGDWMHRHNLTCATRWMENDAPPHVIAAWEKGSTCISDWQPSAPAGDGWFIGSIHDTEDGPVCIWLREVK
ncbi:hypothetical protein Entas_4556 (plasmid) [Enterobacter soli]|uniref:hypothetical protein n=1 Tax=Enterobacter soli TaxID=885040 RepID=UPI000223CF58|nr:hypothetical protein [Enterobacter soli]AEN67239.1 hypothetical protein Entas_4556 [Enterobacter soli]OAT34991.1 hypothetical protein M987_04602 [Enterobacter soli ATCC BAA-2102]